jgi:1-acyl-sn-glycerol-3-phosphate acyltransferase
MSLSLMEKIRSQLFAGIWTLWTSVFGVVLIGIIALGSRPHMVRVCTRIWARGVVWLLRVIVGLTHEIDGLQNIPTNPCLIISNHQSAWETIVYLLFFPDVAIVTKKELLRIPIFGAFLKRSPMIPIDRDAGTKALRQMVDEGLRAIQQGRSVLIFPEGTRQAPGTRIEFKRGVELLYAKLDVPLLPVAMNSGEFWFPGNQSKRAGTIRVKILAAIPAGEKPQEAIKAAEYAVQQALDSLH